MVVIGPHDPDKPDALTAEQIEAGTAAGVRFLGLHDDVDLLYRGMDLFVLASHREGFPRATMEAAASGLATVATDIRGCRQVVDDGVTGLLVPVRSPARLADAIRRLGDDEGRRAAMGVAAIARRPCSLRRAPGRRRCPRDLPSRRNPSASLAAPAGHVTALAYRRRLRTRRRRSSNAIPPWALRSKYRMPSLRWMADRASR